MNVSAALSNRLLSNDLKALFPGVNAIMQAKMSLEIATAYKASGDTDGITKCSGTLYLHV